MKILYYDLFSGISGDMNLAAIIDLGVPKEYLISELSKLNLDDEFKIDILKEFRTGIKGTMVKVSINNHEEKHKHRNFNDVKKIIEDSSLCDYVKELSIKIFRKIAFAEAKVHGKTVEEVHFHEIGAIDSIVDIVGAAILINKLKPDKIISSPLELGGGFVNCAHGIMPVPAPATSEIVKNMKVKIGGTNFESTTPTGAAIVNTISDEYVDSYEFLIEDIGYGIGHKESKTPNILRIFSGVVS